MAGGSYTRNTTIHIDLGGVDADTAIVGWTVTRTSESPAVVYHVQRAQSSQLTLTSLNDGSHAVRVHAIDVAGNVDMVGYELSWVVDNTKPTGVLSTAAVVAPGFGPDAAQAGGLYLLHQRSGAGRV